MKRRVINDDDIQYSVPVAVGILDNFRHNDYEIR